MSNPCQNPNLQYPQDVTPGNLRGIAHAKARALHDRFPKGWTVGPMGGGWFCWDAVGNVVGMGDTRAACIDATIENNVHHWRKS